MGKDNITFEFDPYIAEKIGQMRKKKSQQVREYINRKHNELKRKRKKERQNRKHSV